MMKPMEIKHLQICGAETRTSPVASVINTSLQLHRPSSWLSAPPFVIHEYGQRCVLCSNNVSFTAIAISETTLLRSLLALRTSIIRSA
jgi:hypothetical protein